MSNPNRRWFDGRVIENAGTSPFGKIVSDFYSTEANYENTDVIELSNDVGGGVMASKFHMDYTKVLEDAVDERIQNVQDQISSSESGAGNNAVNMIKYNQNPSLDKTFHTIINKLQLLEHFCLLINQNVTISDKNGTVLPKTGQGSLPYCLAQVTHSEPMMTYDLAAASSDLPPVSNTMVEDLVMPMTYPTPGAPANINYADIVTAAVVGWTIPGTYNNSGYSGYTYNDIGGATAQVMVGNGFVRFLDTTTNSNYNLALVVQGLLHNLDSIPNPNFTPLGGYIITIQDYASTGSDLLESINPASFTLSSGSGDYASIQIGNPIFDAVAYPGKVKVTTGYTAVQGTNYPVELSSIPITNSTEATDSGGLLYNADAPTSAQRKTLLIQKVDNYISVINVLSNRPDLTALKIVLTDESNNTATLHPTNAIVGQDAIIDTSYFAVQCNEEIFTTLAAAEIVSVAGITANVIMSIQIN
jgi:hypothetical protein